MSEKQQRCRAMALLLGLSAWIAPAECQVLPPPLRNGTSRIRWSSYVQLRYSALEGAEDLYALRRFKLMVGGNLSPKVQWYAQGLFKDGNHSPTDGRAYFQEAWLRFALRKRFQLVAGQFKPPFGRERFTPDFEIFTMDRSLVTDALTPDGPYIDSFYRDRGVQADGEIGRGWRYAVGIFDGRGANHGFRGVGPMAAFQMVDEFVRERRLAGRATTLRAGVAAAFRRGGDLPFRRCCEGEAGSGLEHFRGADRRWGVEFSGDWGDVSLRAEYIRARLNFAAPELRDYSAGGWYVQGAKRLRGRWQAVMKYERFDPNDSVVNSKDARQTTLGINYSIRRNRAKVMAAYVIRQERVRPVANNLFQLQFQYFLH